MDAFHLFPGDKRPYLVLAAIAAIDADRLEEAEMSLQRFLGTSEPEKSDLDALIVGLLALVFQKQGDPIRALEIVNRLPLRRRDLNHPLLVGLCVRASAKYSLGKRADAKRDLDRVHAIDPEFPMLTETEKSRYPDP
ncbi:MAG: hypothetical protein KY455_09090 [Euryarchaeota archaeon]|nr:hypothetical protein [Euryarchaeota archaeon]